MYQYLGTTMNRELSDKLYNEFSELYKSYRAFPEVGDGWYNLLRNLSLELYEALDKEEIEDISILQIKEKFGTLRYYASCTSNKAEDIIQKYEDLSGDTCEDCGNVGDIAKQSGGWVRTICKSCKIKDKLQKL